MSLLLFQKLLLISFLLVPRGNRKNDNFDVAKRWLYRIVYQKDNHEFYCNCIFNQKTLDVSAKECGYIPKNKLNKRSRKIEAEHVAPAEWFGRHFPEYKGDPRCGKKRGRVCVTKLNREYRLMQADLYNLKPAVGELNQLRSNYPYAIIEEPFRQFGACNFKVVKKKTEPKKDIRGDIARTYFYMEWAYPGKFYIPKEMKPMLNEWDKEDPISEDERYKAQIIETLQGNTNPFILGRDE